MRPIKHREYPPFNQPIVAIEDGIIYEFDDIREYLAGTPQKIAPLWGMGMTCDNPCMSTPCVECRARWQRKQA